MIIPYENSYITINPDFYFGYPAFRKISFDRRSLFKKGIFQVKEDKYGFQLFVNGRYVGGWIKNNSSDAESVINVAFNVYQAMGGK